MSLEALGHKVEGKKISCSVEYEAYKDILKNFISSLSINVSNWNYFYVNKGKMFITCSISNSSFWFLYLILNIKIDNIEIVPRLCLLLLADNQRNITNKEQS